MTKKVPKALDASTKDRIALGAPWFSSRVCDHTGKVNYKLPRRGMSGGRPPKGLRNWDCRVDGHEDPDNSGACIHCGMERP